MRFVVVTIFPEFFPSPLAVGLLGRALEGGLVQVETVRLRDFTHDRHQSVDDTSFGGGPGMVMRVEPLVEALEHVKVRWQVGRTILLSPRGRRFDQACAREYAAHETICLVCGRYEGVDERLVEGGFVDEELSIGDFVLNGGEAAALAVIECCSRLVPGVVGKEESVARDSFFDGLLDHPHYTKPREFRGLGVPEVLLSGNHAEIDRWRRKQSLKATAERRPDLLALVELSEADRRLLRS
ncbi:MAG: tRNA (guanosine(37)-N1)-methyltransferase TrmD [Deltaproteobacteria bacterium]|nr:tRNA (guanosine(37)-N1)-methyltransferase TrmD [Deltaproteobacteria bacterium]